MAIGAAVGVLVVVAVFAVGRPRRVVVEGRSMEPTLNAGDRLIVLRRTRPRTGEIVAFADPRARSPLVGKPALLVKRVVAVTGTTLVVEGDNAGGSTDSRSFGPVERGAVIGRVVYRYGPAGRTGRLG